MAVTAVAVLGGLGMLPSAADGGSSVVARTASAPAAQPASEPTSEPDVESAPTTWPAGRPDRRDLVVDPTAGLPARSGDGRRVVFSESDQRVWLVDAREQVVGSWLVSGSVLDNLQPGTYEVWSRSRHAFGIDNSGVMEFFVRFTRGPSGAAIGFHSIPTKDDVALQTRAELGTPTSHGCIRQRRSDARRTWDFAGLGTTVVVTP